MWQGSLLDAHESEHGARRSNDSCARRSRTACRLAEQIPKVARERIIRVSRRAFELLADHPLPGREAEDGRRELALSRGKFGYVAKYRWLPDEDVVLTLAVRHQLEAG